jgi:hypothetical protein
MDIFTSAVRGINLEEGKRGRQSSFGGQATLPDDFITPFGQVLNYFVTGYDNNNLYEIIVYGHYAIFRKTSIHILVINTA